MQMDMDKGLARRVRAQVPVCLIRSGVLEYPEVMSDYESCIASNVKWIDYLLDALISPPILHTCAIRKEGGPTPGIVVDPPATEI